MRTPLHERVNDSWTLFESRLYNLVSKGLEEASCPAYFSRRLRIAEALLDQFDAEVALIRETGELTAYGNRTI